MPNLKWLILSLILIACNSSKLDLQNSKVEICYDTNAGLIGTQYTSLEQLKECIDIQYDRSGKKVAMMHRTPGYQITCSLAENISQKDLENARRGNLLKKISLGLQSPYSIMRRTDLVRAFHLSRRKGVIYGEGDMSFYDIALHIKGNMILSEDTKLSKADLGDKGIFNSYNHILSQAFITAIFSETMADYIGDLHELKKIPELVHGNFSEEQLTDRSEGALDNYVDLINNAWGQKLGKQLKEKYKITRKTLWTPYLLTCFLNDIQSYFSWAFDINLKPFKKDEELITKFSAKINRVLTDLPSEKLSS